MRSLPGVLRARLASVRVDVPLRGPVVQLRAVRIGLVVRRDVRAVALGVATDVVAPASAARPKAAGVGNRERTKEQRERQESNGPSELRHCDIAPMSRIPRRASASRPVASGVPRTAGGVVVGVRGEENQRHGWDGINPRPELPAGGSRNALAYAIFE